MKRYRQLSLLVVLVTSCLTAKFSTYATPVLQQALIDTEKKCVGEIPILSDITSTGAKSYSIPLNEPAGINGLQPNLTLVYNSQAGDSNVGRGWNLQGIPTITRTVGSKYFDEQPKPIKMTYSDCFALDGSRILYTNESFDDGMMVYETEQGNIKVRPVIQNNAVCYFEVYYPDGKKGIFGELKNTVNQVCYPLTSLSDMDGNKISYIYSNSGNNWRISSIHYNGFAITFNYTSRIDPSFHYIGGNRVSTQEVMESITYNTVDSFTGVKSKLWTYTLEYDTSSSYSLLSTVRYNVGSEELNPLRFSYGDFQSTGTFSTSKTEFTKWLETGSPSSKVKVARGRCLPNSGTDCLIVYPKAYPYWNSASSTFINRYESGQNIYVYANLQASQASEPPFFLTGSGFVDVLCADLSGNQIDNIVKINNVIVNGKDRVQFNVYDYSNNGLKTKYTRTFDFDTVIKNSSGQQSPQPKTFYAGDFDGDGRMEILALCAEVGGTTLTESKVYVFDLESNSILWQGHLFDYKCYFIGLGNQDENNIYDSSDKVIPLDYNGDGIVDLCHINYKGTYFYTFSTIGSSYRWNATVVNTTLKNDDLRNHSSMPCDLNGDGLPDLLVSSLRTDNNDTAWTAYYGTGDGNWAKKSFKGPKFTNENGAGMFTMDIDRDGSDDLIIYNKNILKFYRTIGQIPGEAFRTTYMEEYAIPIPIDINSHSKSSNLVTLKDGVLKAHTYCNDIREIALIKTMINSLGVEEHVTYSTIDDKGIHDGIYTISREDTFPYVQLQEQLAVVSRVTKQVGSKTVVADSIRYHNGVFHRHGFGFCGFEKMTIDNIKGQTIIKEYDPYNFGTLVSEKGPGYERNYEYTVSYKSPASKHKVISLVKKEDKDLLKEISCITTYEYDSYGLKTKEISDFGDRNKTETHYYYYSNPQAGEGYYLGIQKNTVSTSKNTHSSVGEAVMVSAIDKGKPTIIRHSINGYRVSEKKYVYNDQGLPTQISEKLYQSPDYQVIRFEYDQQGRVIKETDNLGRVTQHSYSPEGYKISTTDCRGNVTTFDYDMLGRLSWIDYPDSTFAYYEYKWNNSVPDALYSVTFVPAYDPITMSVYNGIGQEIRSAEKDPFARWKFVDKEYDIRGNLVKQTLPHLETNECVWRIFNYDSYDRILSEHLNGQLLKSISYNKNSITTTDRGVTETRSFDSMGRLKTIVNAAGTYSYTVAGDGQIVMISSPGNITTSISYDTKRRRISINDPNAGRINWIYDASGNLSKEQFANGNTIEMTYDNYGRILTCIHPEFTTTYTYDKYGDLSSLTSDNGTSTTYAYDAYGRTSSVKYTAPNKVSLTKNYSYTYGHLTGIQSISNYGTSVTEKLSYKNGHHMSTTVNDTVVVFKVNNETDLGQYAEIETGPYKRTYDYTVTGLPTNRSLFRGATLLQGQTYDYDQATYLLKSRKDVGRQKDENFKYDNLHRLTEYGGDRVSYDSNENILSKSDIGIFNYQIQGKPYTLSSIEATQDLISLSQQRIKYTSYSRPDSIIEGKYRYSFTYDGNYERVRSTLFSGKLTGIDKFYLGGTYEQSNIAWEVMQQDSIFTRVDSIRAPFDPNPPIIRPLSDVGSTIVANRFVEERFYIGGDYYSAYAIMVKYNGKIKLYYLNRDMLGSITAILDNEGNIVQELSFDAWGNLRNPDTYALSSSGDIKAPLFDRGYCGHEHLPYFGLINMNARLYDPLVGRFTAADPYIQEFDNRLNFNRYAYALNNPLAYVDEDGEMPAILIGALIGGAFNLGSKMLSGQVHSFKDGLVAFGIGAVAGGVAAVTGGIGFSAFGGGTAGAGGFIAGAMGGISGSALSVPIENIGNHLYFGDPVMTPKEYLLGLAFSGLSAGLSNGITAEFNGREFWSGAEKMSPTALSLAYTNGGSTYLSPYSIEEVDMNGISREMRTASTWENHHFGTNKNKTYTPQIEERLKDLKLKLKDSWNIRRMPHRGRHPNLYHEWVIKKMDGILQMPEMNTLNLAGKQQLFIKQFNLEIIQPVLKNPDMLYKKYWIMNKP